MDKEKALKFLRAAATSLEVNDCRTTAENVRSVVKWLSSQLPEQKPWQQDDDVFCPKLNLWGRVARVENELYTIEVNDTGIELTGSRTDLETMGWQVR